MELWSDQDVEMSGCCCIMDSGSRLLDCHLQHIYDVAAGESGIMEALHILEMAICMVKHRKGFNVARFHLKRVQALGRGNKELDLHLNFLKDCVDIMYENIAWSGK